MKEPDPGKLNRASGTLHQIEHLRCVIAVEVVENRGRRRSGDPPKPPCAGARRARNVHYERRAGVTCYRALHVGAACRSAGLIAAAARRVRHLGDAQGLAY